LRFINRKKQLFEFGIIINVGDGVANIYGLPNVQANELVIVKKSIYGLTMNLQKKNYWNCFVWF